MRREELVHNLVILRCALLRGRRSRPSPDPPICSSSLCSDPEAASLCFLGEGGVDEVLLPSRLLPDDGCASKGRKTLLNCSEPKGTLVPVLASYSVLSNAARRARA
jgi:hypothetical protein